MTMTMKLNKLITFIRENSQNGEIQLFPSVLSEIGLNPLEAEKLIDGLSKSKAVLHKRIAFAPNKVQSTYPKQASFSSVENTTYNVPVFLLRTDDKKLGEILSENLTSSFDDKKAIIKIGKEFVELPQGKNEHCFCRAAFHHSVDDAVDWSEIYEEMTGVDVFGDKEAAKGKWRVVYDAMEAINGKVRKQTEAPLFAWSEKTVRRLY